MLLQDLAVQSVINLTIVVLLFILGLITSFRQMKLEKIVSRTFYFGVGLFFITYGICRLIFWLGPFFDLVLPDFKFGYFVGNTIGLGSVVILMYAVESNILTRSKHFFSIYGTMGVVLMIISIFVRVQWYGNSFIAWIQYFTVPVLGGVFVLIFFFLSIKTKGRARTYSLIVVIGVISLCFGEMANTSIANQIFPWIGPLYINSILILIGAILIFSFSWNIEQYFKLLKEYYTTKYSELVNRINHSNRWNYYY